MDLAVIELLKWSSCRPPGRDDSLISEITTAIRPLDVVDDDDNCSFFKFSANRRIVWGQMVREI